MSKNLKNNYVKEINDLSKSIFKGNEAKGFWDKRINIGEKLMLVTSELSEALEADRKKSMDKTILENFVNEYNNTSDGYVKTQEEIDDNFIASFKNNIKDSFQDEIADAIIRLLDLSGGLGIDIGTHIELKLKYNATRAHMHGKKY